MSSFLRPLEPYRSQVGALIFEFTKFNSEDFDRGRDFVEVLRQFISQLPTGWQYGVEIRNASFLTPQYFEVLAEHGVAHVYNSWTEMPSVLDQIKTPNSQTAGFSVSRFLLRPGRIYTEAVDSFSPYASVQDEYPEARVAGAEIIKRAMRGGKIKENPSFVYVNNRLEGNSIGTIQGMLDRVRISPDT